MAPGSRSQGRFSPHASEGSPPRRPARPTRRRPRRAGGTLRDAERRALARASRAREAVAPPAAGWAVLWCDGGSRGNPGPAAYAYVLDGSDGAALASGSGRLGVATAGVAEYWGLRAGLERALELGLRRLEARLDSRLVVAQLAGERLPRNPKLRRLAAEVADLRERIGAVRLVWVPSEQNGRADALVQAELDRRDGVRRA